MMNTYATNELAYMDGYEQGYDKGYDDGYNEGFDKGYHQAVETIGVRIGFWKYTSDGSRKCSECGMLEPDSLPGACTIYEPEKRYCFYCGARLIYPEKQ